MRLLVILAESPLLLSSLLIFSLLYGHSHCHAQAKDLPATQDQSLPRPPDALGRSDAVEDLNPGYQHLVDRYIPSFLGISRGIIGRADDEIKTLSNNVPGKPDKGVEGGQSQHYIFPKKALLGPKSPSPLGLPSNWRRNSENAGRGILSDELRKRQNLVELFITINTCNQPMGKSAASPISLYISTSSDNHKPDQGRNDGIATADGGYAGLNITASDDVFFTVSLPDNDGFPGNYDYELTASIDDYYAVYNGGVNNEIIDTDNTAVLLYTNNVTSSNSSQSSIQQWMSTRAFSVYVQNQKNPALIGLERSWCALDQHAQVKVGQDDTDTSMTTAVDGLVKQQFHVQGLNGSSDYYAIVAIDGNSTKTGQGVVNGGGTVYKSTNFTTKSDNVCAIVYNLTFCTDVGYAVPYNYTNQTINSTTNLGNYYDNYTRNAYTYFDFSLQQVPCNTTSSARYSLARNCTDCADAYKKWLCAVSIPRCQDYSNQANYLQPRALNQTFFNNNLPAKYADGQDLGPKPLSKTYYAASRNQMIDTDIQPLPYKEVLPCKEICYNLVQSCPALLQFACPLPGFGLNWTYGNQNSSLPPGEHSCNAMGILISGANSLKAVRQLGFSMALITALFVTFT